MHMLKSMNDSFICQCRSSSSPDDVFGSCKGSSDPIWILWTSIVGAWLGDWFIIPCLKKWFWQWQCSTWKWVNWQWSALESKMDICILKLCIIYLLLTTQKDDHRRRAKCLIFRRIHQGGWAAHTVCWHRCCLISTTWDSLACGHY